jgi:hypothetical protein
VAGNSALELPGISSTGIPYIVVNVIVIVGDSVVLAGAYSEELLRIVIEE